MFLGTLTIEERVTTHTEVGNWPPNRSLDLHMALNKLTGDKRVTTHINVSDNQWRVRRSMWTYHWPVKANYHLTFILHRLAFGHLTHLNVMTNKKQTDAKKTSII